ncbi:Bacterial capsule synthesis protein [Streptomyces sp. AVP053U2]|nr:Bacterial capsule synthesis protein [Streptomyces sp. AVP053U2]
MCGPCKYDQVTLRKSLPKVRVAAALVALTALLASCGTADGSVEPQAKPGGHSFTVAAAGDVLIHPEIVEQAAKDAKATGGGEAGLDFGPTLAGVKPVISKADLAICHMETPWASPKAPSRDIPSSWSRRRS